MLTPTERRIMEHALGWRKRRQPGHPEGQFYRNHFVVGADDHSWISIIFLVARELMAVRYGPDEDRGGMWTFSVTDRGVSALHEAERLDKEQAAWIRAQAEFSRLRGWVEAIGGDPAKGGA